MRHRTALLTAASIAGVALAGAAAIGASLGILDASADSDVGALSAADPSAVTAQPTDPVTQPTVIDVYVDDPAPTATATAEPTATVGAETTYTVEDAGTVRLLLLPDGSVVVASVETNQGWTWTQDGTRKGGVVVVFTNGDTTYQLIANGGPDGIEARVEQPIVEVVTVPGSSGTGGTGGAAPAPTAAPTAAPAAPTATAAPTTAPTSDDDAHDDDSYDDEDGNDEDSDDSQDSDDHAEEDDHENEDEGNDYDD